MTANVDTTTSGGPTLPEDSLLASSMNHPSVHLSEGFLRLNFLTGLKDIEQARRSNHEMLAASLEKMHGKPVLSTDSEMIAVESPITTNHYHQAPPAKPAGVPGWLKAAAVIGGLIASGAGGAVFSGMLAPKPAPQAPQPEDKPDAPAKPDKSYALDFWEPKAE